MLGRKDMSLQDIVNVLKEFHKNIGDDPDELVSHKSGSGESPAQEAETQRMILDGLIAFLDSV